MVDSFTGREPDGSYRSNAVDALYAVSCLIDPTGQTLRRPTSSRRSGVRCCANVRPGTRVGQLAMRDLASSGVICSSRCHSRHRSYRSCSSGTRYDPATPYAWAEAVSKQLPNNRLVTYEDDGHTGYGDNSCEPSG